MEFLSIREFSSSPKKTQEILKSGGKIVITNNGKPSMLVLDITGQDFEKLIDRLNRAEAMRLNDEKQEQTQVQTQAQAEKSSPVSKPVDDIDDVISLNRRRKRTHK